MPDPPAPSGGSNPFGTDKTKLQRVTLADKSLGYFDPATGEYFDAAGTRLAPGAPQITGANVVSANTQATEAGATTRNAATIAAENMRAANALAATIADQNTRAANVSAQLQFDKDKLTVETAAGLRADAAATATRVQAGQIALQQAYDAHDQLVAQAQNLQANLQASYNQWTTQLGNTVNEANAGRIDAAQVENARNSFTAANDALNRTLSVANAVEQSRQFNITQRTAIADKVAQFVRTPGDAAAAAGALLAQGGSGATAITRAVTAGKGSITDFSLAGGQALLDSLKQLDAPNPAQPLWDQAATAAPVQQVTPTIVQQPTLPAAPVVGAPPQQRNVINPGGGGAPANTGGGQSVTAPNGAVLTFNPNSNANGLAGVTAGGQAFGAGSGPAVAPAMPGIPAKANGGFVGEPGGIRIHSLNMLARGGNSGGTAYVSGDPPKGSRKPNPELNIPVEGGMMVIPLNQLGKRAKEIVAHLTHKANGGIVDYAPGSTSSATQDAQNLLDTSVRFGLGRLGLTQLPTPLGVSAPGTDPLVQQEAAGITESGTGYPSASFLNEIGKIKGLAPMIASAPVSTRVA